MRNKLGAVSAFIISILLLFGVLPCSAESVGATEIFNGILESGGASSSPEDIAELIDGELASSAGIGSEWYALALAQHGNHDLSAYESALLLYLEKNSVYSASSRLKYALCLAAVGSTNSYIQKAIDTSLGEQGLMSWVFGLHLLNNGYTSEKYSVSAVKAKLLSLQLADGGWAVSGQYGEVDATAMTLQALAPYIEKDQNVASAADSALTFLSQKQLDGGDFSSYGAPNPESTAQVLIALSALGIDFADDSRFIKNGNTLLDGILKYQLEDKSFCHVEGGTQNGTSTVQVLCATVAYLRFSEGKAPLYTLDRADPENAESAPDETTKAEQESTPSLDSSYKLSAVVIIIAAGAVVCILLFIFKKRNLKNFIAILIVTALLAALVCMTDIRSAEDYYGETEKPKDDPIGSVTLSIRCDEIAGLADHIPENGIILDSSEFIIEENDTVYSILIEAAKKHKIHLENDGNAAMPYISGIAYIYEQEFGELSGWVYTVNGKRASVGAGEYVLCDGDAVEWYYTTNFGGFPS